MLWIAIARVITSPRVSPPPNDEPTPTPSATEWAVITATINNALRASAPESAPRSGAPTRSSRRCIAWTKSTPAAAPSATRVSAALPALEQQAQAGTEHHAGGEGVGDPEPLLAAELMGSERQSAQARGQRRDEGSDENEDELGRVHEGEAGPAAPAPTPPLPAEVEEVLQEAAAFALAATATLVVVLVPVVPAVFVTSPADLGEKVLVRRGAPRSCSISLSSSPRSSQMPRQLGHASTSTPSRSTSTSSAPSLGHTIAVPVDTTHIDLHPQAVVVRGSLCHRTLSPHGHFCPRAESLHPARGAPSRRGGSRSPLIRLVCVGVRPDAPRSCYGRSLTRSQARARAFGRRGC